MEFPPLADLDDMTARLEEDPVGRELGRAAGALDDASTEVRFVARKTWVTDDGALDDDVPDIVRRITITVAIRAYLNPPDGVRQESETLGDHTKSVTMDVRTGVYLTEDEKAQVRDAAGNATTGGLWTLSTTREDDTGGCVYYDVEGGDSFPPTPWGAPT